MTVRAVCNLGSAAVDLSCIVFTTVACVGVADGGVRR
jgi:hypothetical protein